MSTHLEPCPLCGGSAKLKTQPESWGYHSGSVEVQCTSCGASAGYQDDESKKAEARAAWNRRTNIHQQALEYIYGKYDNWEQVVSERWTPPLPLEHHLIEQGLRKKNGS